jgi:cytochrome P450
MALSWVLLASSTAAIGALHLLLSITRFLLSTRRPKGYPPGPPPILGLGNLHQIPLERPFLKFHEWSKVYGDIVGLKMGPKNFVVISSPSYVRELFQKRGTKYSGRPHAPIPQEHVIKPGDQYILFLPDDAYLRKWRSAARHILSPEGVEKVAPLQAATAQKLAYSILRQPEFVTDHVHEWSLATPLLTIAGLRVRDFGPGFVQRYQDVQHDW